MRRYAKIIAATLLASYGAFVLVFGIFAHNYNYKYSNSVPAETTVLPVYWDEIEIERLDYDFSAVAAQLQKITQRGDTAAIALGYKLQNSEGVSECIFPDWYDHSAPQFTKDKYLFQMLRTTVNRFENNPSVVAWQIEHEPSVALAGCPEFDPNLLNAEIALVEGIDDADKEIIVDRGRATLSDFHNWLKHLVN